MRRIGLLSDTHGFLDPAVYEYFAECDEIWHAGDFGPVSVALELADLLLKFDNEDNAAVFADSLNEFQDSQSTF